MPKDKSENQSEIEIGSKHINNSKEGKSGTAPSASDITSQIET